MTKIRIIASFHKEILSFKHLELLEILKRFSPDIIFEKLDNDTFEIIYNEQKSFALEPKAILPGAEHKYSLEKDLDLNAIYPDKQWIYGLD